MVTHQTSKNALMLVGVHKTPGAESYSVSYSADLERLCRRWNLSISRELWSPGVVSPKLIRFAYEMSSFSVVDTFQVTIEPQISTHDNHAGPGDLRSSTDFPVSWHSQSELWNDQCQEAQGVDCWELQGKNLSLACRKGVSAFCTKVALENIIIYPAFDKRSRIRRLKVSSEEPPRSSKEHLIKQRYTFCSPLALISVVWSLIWWKVEFVKLALRGSSYRSLLYVTSVYSSETINLFNKGYTRGPLSLPAANKIKKFNSSYYLIRKGLVSYL